MAKQRWCSIESPGSRNNNNNNNNNKAPKRVDREAYVSPSCSSLLSSVFAFITV
jgi:hypothetical protein